MGAGDRSLRAGDAGQGAVRGTLASASGFGSLHPVAAPPSMAARLLGSTANGPLACVPLTETVTPGSDAPYKHRSAGIAPRPPRCCYRLTFLLQDRELLGVAEAVA